MTIRELKSGVYRLMPAAGKRLVSRSTKSVVDRPWFVYLRDKSEAASWEEVTRGERRALLDEWGDSARHVSVWAAQA